MRDLHVLQSASPSQVELPPELLVIQSPLRQAWQVWSELLACHPDQEFAAYVLHGIKEGFMIGFHQSCHLVKAQRNTPSASAHPEVVEQYLSKEITMGRIMGPFPEHVVPQVQISRMGVIPKGHNQGKWRLITDLSFPPGSSVNDGIDPNLCSLCYTSVGKVAEAAQGLGTGALLAKVDIESAYRLIPVAPHDRVHLGVKWHDGVYIDGMLPFGLRSAPKIFTAVADALEWCLRHEGVSDVDHYLDDFITIGAPGSDQCQRNLTIISQTCSRLGVPLATDKTEGPTTCIVFLGIEIDTMAGVLRLPEEKLHRIKRSLQQWVGRRTCQRRELESLIGLLQHACRVVRPGRSFLRRMIDLLTVAHSSYHHIRLNRQFAADLLWWRTFLSAWNGTYVFPPQREARIEFASDASGGWGCGACCGQHWWQYQWPHSETGHHISFLELGAVLMACAVWGREWHGCLVLCWCDNQAAVQAIRARSCKDPGMMHLLRCLFFFEATFQFELVANHIPGVDNQQADLLSRDKLDQFFSLSPQALPTPSPIPPQLPPMLFSSSLDLASPTWMELSSITV